MSNRDDTRSRSSRDGAKSSGDGSRSGKDGARSSGGGGGAMSNLQDHHKLICVTRHAPFHKYFNCFARIVHAAVYAHELVNVKFVPLNHNQFNN